MSADGGKFVISLDFEILWGVCDQFTIETYGDNLKGVQTAIPRLLEIFDEYRIKATFATVGLLFFESKKELFESIKFPHPQYKHKEFSPYTTEIFKVGESVETDKYHFAPHLIRKIKAYPEQEIATHTFSHYYCLEEGQTIDDFMEDIKAAISIGSKHGIAIKSIIFPRNQFNADYLEVCTEYGIVGVRGNEDSWIYSSRNFTGETKSRRAFRFLDAYINISGHHCYSDEFMAAGRPYNIPSSRFLRPYIKGLGWLDSLRLHRIKNSMTFAAKNGLTYHLWWHPHNFGINQDKNFSFLKQILEHYDQLNKQYNFTSYHMAGVSDYLQKKYGA